jgi:hypothetical protein
VAPAALTPLVDVRSLAGVRIRSHRTFLAFDAYFDALCLGTDLDLDNLPGLEDVG